MRFSFINGVPAILIKREKTVVVGDLHLGRELKLIDSGIYLANASKRSGAKLADICKKNNAERLVFLGDIKEGIAYPVREEYQTIKSFFDQIPSIDIKIAKGNHDAHIAEILERIGLSAEVKKEILLGKSAFMHGNSLPSEEAMMKELIVVAHGHISINMNGNSEKAYLLAKIGKGVKKLYKRCNKEAMLLVMPAFNDIVTGTNLNKDLRNFIPLFRNNLFDFNSAEIYTLNRKLVEKTKVILDWA